MDKRLIQVLAIVSVAAIAILFGWRQVVDGDFFYHVANGRDILARGMLPTVNTYVWAPSDLPYSPNPAWLYGVLIALVEGAGGLVAVASLKTLVVLSLFGTLYAVCRHHGAGPLLSATLLFIVGMGTAFRITDRPHLFSLLFFALCLFLLDRRPGKLGNRWLLPFVFVVWANVHSGYIVGLLLLFAVLGGKLLDGDWHGEREKVKHHATTTLLCVAATFCVPRPLDNLSFLFGLLTPREYPIGEYLSPEGLAFLWFYVPAIILFAWAVWRRFQPRRWKWIAPIPVLFVLGVVFARFIPYFLMGALPWMAQSLGGGVPQVKRWAFLTSRPVRLVGGCLFLAALPLAVYLWTPVPARLGPGVDPAIAPMGSVRFLEEARLEGRFYNSQSFGGLGAMYLFPHYTMYQSAFFQVERDRIEEAYLAARTPTEWREFLDRHRIDIVWLDSAREPHSLEYYPQDKWALLYFDDFSVLYARRDGVSRQAVAERELRVANPALLSSLTGPEGLRDPFVAQVGLQEARSLLRYDPENWMARAMEALFLARLPGQEQAALDTLTLLEQRDPGNSGVLLEKGRLLVRQGRPTDAVQSLERYRDMAPDDPEGVLLLANALRASGEGGPARELLLQMTQRFPDHAGGHLLLGSLLLGESDLAGARESLTKARELQPANAEVYNLLGIVKAQQGDLPGAIILFRQALALDPALQPAAKNLQRALMERGG